MPVYTVALGGSVGRERRGMDGTPLGRSRSQSSVNGDPGPSVLGESFRAGQNPKQRKVMQKETGINEKNASKLPRAPRPERTSKVFKAAAEGLREHIQVCKEGLSQLQLDTIQKLTASPSLQVKTEERRIKRLEYLLSKIEELQDHYYLKRKMYKGARSMLEAFVDVPSRNRRQSVAQVQSGLKECTTTMCAIEAQLETLLGHFEAHLKGVMGFSRVVPGDSFETALSLGHQKWKSRGRITRQGDQEWDVTRHVFKVLLADALDVKLVENKRLTKSKLGTKKCDTLDLFSGRPQNLAIDINQTGTIKLSLSILWNPLHDFREQMMFYNPPEKPSRSVSCIQPISVVYQSNTAHPSTPVGGQKTEFDLSSSNDDSSVGDFTKVMQDFDNMVEDEGADDVLVSVTFDELDRTSPDELNPASPAEIDDSSADWPSSLGEAVRRIKTSLDDLDSSCDNLLEFQEIVKKVCSILEDSKKYQRQSTSSADIAIEMAFDFLNVEEQEAEPDVLTESKVLATSPGSTGQSLADSGVASIINHLRYLDENPTPVDTSLSSRSTGLDRVLIQHFMYCVLLMENLGSVGPLKFHEKDSITKLNLQIPVFKNLAQLVKVSLSKNSHLENARDLLQLMSSHHVSLDLWEEHLSEHLCFCSQEEFKDVLMQQMDSSLQDQYDLDSSEVFHLAVSGVVDLESFPVPVQDKVVVTLPQLLQHLTNQGFSDVYEYIQHLATRLWVLDNLKSGNTLIVSQAIQSLESSNLSKDSVTAVLRLLVTPNETISNSAERFFEHVFQEEACQAVLVGLIMGALEDTRTDIRSGACLALKKLKVTEAMDQLSYVAQSDHSKRVQSLARQALTSLAEHD